MVVVEVAGEHTPEVGVTHHDDVIEALPPDAAVASFRRGSLPGTPRDRGHVLQAQARHASPKRGARHGIAITE